MRTRPELDKLLPYGMPATRQWLLASGMSRHQFDNAVKSGQLNPLARGVVARPGLPVTWQGLVAALQQMQAGCVYVGGITALAQSGMGHYMQTSHTIHLYGDFLQPAWVKRLDLGVNFEWHSTRLLWSPKELEEARSLQEIRDVQGWSYRVAAPEQAFMELLRDVPDAVSFEHADQLMQGMTSLSPRRLDALMRACRHVKVKRLFLYFAERHGHAWLDHLDRDDYDLGAGKRVVARAGRLDSTYQITVPEAFDGQE
jgi:hypothetical protein